MTLQSCLSKVHTDNIQLRGNDEAVLAQCLYAFFSEQAVGGSDIPGGERVRGVCVSVLPVTCC